MILNSTQTLTAETKIGVVSSGPLSVVDFADITATLFIAASQTQTVDVVSQIIVPAPASGVSRQVKYINIFNPDTTQHTITIILTSGFKLIEAVVPIGATLTWSQDGGWTVIDGDGNDLPIGGTANQALTKIDSSDFNAQWSTIDPDFVGAEPADATILKDADIGGSVQAWDADLDIFAANGLTAAELGELQNINTVTITNAQWAFLGAFDQGLTITSNVLFGTGTFSGILSVDDTTDSSSTTTGSIHTDGGLGVTKQLRVGNRIVIDSAAFPSINFNISGIRKADMFIDGANNFAIRTNDVNALIISNSNQGANFLGRVFVDDTSDSTSTVTGSIQTDGGLGVVKALHVGGEVFLNLPVVNTGTSGSLWNDAGTVKVVP